MDVLVSIKSLVIAQQVIFTEKAQIEMLAESLTPELVFEAILNAPAIFKTLRSRNPRTGSTEQLHIIKGLTFGGVAIYTKGKVTAQPEGLQAGRKG
jgi:hypothetical protein